MEGGGGGYFCLGHTHTYTRAHSRSFSLLIVVIVVAGELPLLASLVNVTKCCYNTGSSNVVSVTANENSIVFGHDSHFIQSDITLDLIILRALFLKNKIK